jgi:hypothetical protein
MPEHCLVFGQDCLASGLPKCAAARSSLISRVSASHADSKAEKTFPWTVPGDA